MIFDVFILPRALEHGNIKEASFDLREAINSSGAKILKMNSKFRATIEVDSNQLRLLQTQHNHMCGFSEPLVYYPQKIT